LREAVAAELKTKVGCIDIAMEKGEEGKILLSRMLDKFPYQVVFGDSKIWIQKSEEGKEKENPKSPFEYDETKNYEGERVSQKFVSVLIFFVRNVLFF